MSDFSAPYLKNSKVKVDAWSYMA